MPRPCCDPCCFNPPACLKVTVISGGCPCIAGHTFIIHRDYSTLTGCYYWRTDLGDYECVGDTQIAPIMIGLTCCNVVPCTHAWLLGGPSRVWIYSDSLRDDWTCEPFFQHWEPVFYDGVDECLGVPFVIEIEEC